MNHGNEESNALTGDDLERVRLVCAIGALFIELRSMHIRLGVVIAEVLLGTYYLDCVALARSADPVCRRRGLDRLRRLLANGHRTKAYLACDALIEARAEIERRRRARGEQP